MQKSKAVAVITLMFLILACFNPACLAASFGDISNHWAKDYIAEMVDQGIISGYPDGTFKPEGKITRAEFASLLVRGFQLPIGGSKVFSDTANHWAKDFIAAAYSQGIISGYSEYEFGPDDPITREQMAVMIVKAARPDADVEGKTFADNNSIADWARQAVIIATGNNIISGYPDNTFRPKSNTTRAEAAVVLNQTLSLKTPIDETPTIPEEDYSVIDEDGIYGPYTGTETVEGSVTIESPDVTLRNLIITGNLIIAEEVGDGDVTLDNVTVKGKTYIRGGGKDSIYINGGQYNEVIVEKIATKAVRIVAEDVKGLKITIAKEAAGKEIILKGDIDFVSVRADDIKVTTQADTNINEIRVQSGLDDVDIYLDEGTVVDEMVLYSAVAVQGKGKIKEASGSKAKESSFATEPGRVTAPPAGGGGGGSSSTAVSAISVDKTRIALTVGDTETITVTVSPSNATDKRVTFSSSDNNIATIDENGKVTALAGGKATITVTSVADNSKKATVNVVVGDILIPATFADDPSLGTIQNEIDKADEESTIVVMPAAYPKTYNEQLVINKSLTLLGLNTALNGTITITADNVTVDGFNVVAPSDYTLPVIHIIDSDDVNIINNTVIAQGYASIGTSSGPARVTGKISGNTVTGMIIVGTDGELEVCENDVTPTSAEGICFYPVGPEAEIIVTGNKIGQVEGKFAQIKVEQKPGSVNGKTDEVEILSAISEDNYGATVKLGWVKTVGGKAYDDYNNIQEAINAATTGNNIILVYPGEYETENIDIVQKEGVNIILEAVGKVTLKNQIRIDGGGRYEAEDTLTIRGFTFDFSDAEAEGEVITTAKIESANYVYAHNIFIEDCAFIGNSNNVVAVKAAAQGGHYNFQIKGCTGTNLHSLAQLTSVTGVKVEDCNVIDAIEGGLNLQNSIDIEITNLTVKASMDVDSYGVRAGQNTTSPVNENNTMLISNSNLIAKYPIWLRGDAPGTVIITDSTLTASEVGEKIRNDAVGVNVLEDPTVYNENLKAYYMTIQDAITDLADGDTLTILSDELILAEKILFKKNDIIIQGQTDADGKPKTMIKGAGNEVEQFRIEGYNVTVKDLIFDNIADGRAGGGNVRENVGVYFYYPNDVWQADRVNKLINCVSNNTYWAIFSGRKMNFEMEDCTFTKSGTTSSVFMDRPYRVTIKACSFSGQDGYALHIDDGVVEGVVDVSNCNFTGGVVTAGDHTNNTGAGNAVYTFTDCNFYTSSGERGGWYASYYSSGTRFENCTFDADFDGAGTGQYSYSGSYVYLDSNCTWDGNPLDTTFFYNVGDGVLSGVNVTLNSEDEITGGIFVNDPTAKLADGYVANMSDGTWVVSMENSQTLELTANFIAEEEPAEEEGPDFTPINTAIQEAIAAKGGLAVSEDGTDLPAGAYWVTQEDMDAIDAAIANAEAAKESAKTQQDVTNIVEELEAAVSTFNDAKQEAIDDEDLEGTEDPVNDQEAVEDELNDDEQVDTEEDTDDGPEGEAEPVDEENAA